MAEFGPNKVVLPVGTDSTRPASPSNGFMRYNTDRFGVEMYTQAGWIIGGGIPGSVNNPGASGTALYNLGYTTTGNYYIDGGSGAYEAYIKMDYGGGWINVNLSNSVYSTLLSGGAAGSGGTDPLTGSSATGTSLLNASNALQTQNSYYDCGGSSGKAYVDLNSTFASDFGITEARMKIYMVSVGGTTCGPNWTSIFSNTRTIISGTSLQIDGACGNSPNRYADKVSAPFTVEFYGTLSTATRVFQGWTACGIYSGGGYTMRLLEMYVR